MATEPPRIAIIIYSMYGHITTLAETIRAVIDTKTKEGHTKIFQVQETLSDEVLAKMHAQKNTKYDIATPETLTNFDAFLFGIPTRYGNMPAQLKTFWDATGKLWLKGSLAGKYAGVFVSTSGPGGGQEMTPLTFMSTLVHHGIIFVPLGYATGLRELNTLDEVHGGSPWGAGTISGTAGERRPTQKELNIAKCQGKAFYDIVSRVQFK